MNRVDFPVDCLRCTGGPEGCRCDVQPRKAVLLLNLGTPDSFDVPAVRRYLKEFLSDPFVIHLPARWAWATGLLGSLIARFRARRSARAYEKIWTQEGSPLKVITQQQCRALQAELPRGWSVYYAMRYANPSIRSVLGRIMADRITDLVVIPMYPQWAGPTTGTACEVLYQEIARQCLRLNVTVRSDWFDDAAYIEAQAHLVHEFASQRGLHPGNSYLLFSSHSMPEIYIRQGDPYEGHVRRSVELVARRLGWARSRLGLSFQSKLGPVKWLSPSTEEALRRLAEAGEANVLVCPISFTADCLETLEEIGIGYRESFQGTGGQLHLIPALNTYPRFITALRNLVHRPPERLSLHGDSGAPLMQQAREQATNPRKVKDRLVCLGYEVMGPGRKAALAPSEFARIKLPQRESVRVLTELKATEELASAWIWNTCQRLEFYLLVREGVNPEGVAESVCQKLGEMHRLIPTPRLGGRAWRHMLRVAAGLESSLPGDADVLLQLGSAEKMAEHAGTLDASGRHFLRETGKLVESASVQAGWQQFRVSFAEVAIPALLTWDEIRRGRIVVLGGSSTSRSLLRSMVQRQGVDPGRIVVAYRGEGRQGLVRELRQLMGDSPRLRIDRYDDPAVLRAIGEATHVFIGSDGREPFLRRKEIEQLRHFPDLPLTIVDFNLHRSTAGLEAIPGIRVFSAVEIDQAVSAYAQGLLASDDFQKTRRQIALMLDHLADGPPQRGEEESSWRSYSADRREHQKRLNVEALPC
jgi:ferrochelatase